MKNKEQQSENKHFKSNSYEIEKEIKGTVHLDEVPEPHGYGEQITENME